MIPDPAGFALLLQFLGLHPLCLPRLALPLPGPAGWQQDGRRFLRSPAPSTRRAGGQQSTAGILVLLTAFFLYLIAYHRSLNADRALPKAAIADAVMCQAVYAALWLLPAVMEIRGAGADQLDELFALGASVLFLIPI